MKVKNLIWKLIKFNFKNGNFGVVRWKQHTGFVHVTGFDIVDNKVNVTYEEFERPFTFVVFHKHVKDLIKDLFFILLNKGNLEVQMFWNESGSDNCRTGFMNIESVSLVKYYGNVCELS